MAAITAVSSLYNESLPGQKLALYRINNVTSGDTLDVSAVGPVSFHKIQAAMFVGSAQGTAVIGSVTGTVITFTSGGMANDSVDVLVLGV